MTKLQALGITLLAWGVAAWAVGAIQSVDVLRYAGLLIGVVGGACYPSRGRSETMVDRIDAKEWLLTCDALANLRSAEEDIRGPGDGERLFILVGALDEACRAASMFEARVEVLERALVDIAADGKLTPDGAILRARAALAGKGETNA